MMKLHPILALLLLSPLCAMDCSGSDEQQLIQKIINTGTTFNEVRKDLRTFLRDAESTLRVQKDDLTDFAITSTRIRYPFISELAIAALIGTPTSGQFIKNKLYVDASGGYKAEQAVNQLLYSICSVPETARIKSCSELVKWAPYCLESHHLKINGATMLQSKGAVCSWRDTDILSMEHARTIDETPIESDNVPFNKAIETNNGQLVRKKNVDDTTHIKFISQNTDFYCIVDRSCCFQPKKGSQRRSNPIVASIYSGSFIATPITMALLPVSWQEYTSRILSIGEIKCGIVFARDCDTAQGYHNGIHLSLVSAEYPEHSSSEIFFHKPVESCKIISIKEDSHAMQCDINLLVKLKDKAELVSRSVSIPLPE